MGTAPEDKYKVSKKRKMNSNYKGIENDRSYFKRRTVQSKTSEKRRQRKINPINVEELEDKYSD